MLEKLDGQHASGIVQLSSISRCHAPGWMAGLCMVFPAAIGLPSFSLHGPGEREDEDDERDEHDEDDEEEEEEEEEEEGAVQTGRLGSFSGAGGRADGVACTRYSVLEVTDCANPSTGDPALSLEARSVTDGFAAFLGHHSR